MTGTNEADEASDLAGESDRYQQGLTKFAEFTMPESIGTQTHVNVTEQLYDIAPDVEQVTARSASAPATALRSLRRAPGSFRFHPAPFEMIPNLMHAVNKLPGIRLGNVVDGGQARTASWSDVADINAIGDYAPRSANTSNPTAALEITG